MIGLITGVPGSGKTALAVSMMLRFQKEGRPIYQHGVRDLTLAVLPVYCGDDACEFCAGQSGDLLHDFRQWAPSNAVIFLDEVQRQFRVRGRAAQVPQFVADLETHRHLGVDFWLMTQDPRLMDQNIRRLVTIHHHLEPSLIGARKRTFMTCQDDPKRATGGESSTFSPPKEAFRHYKSAELHTKVKKPIPKGIYVLAVALLLGVVGGTAAFDRIQSRLVEDTHIGELAAIESATGGPTDQITQALVSGVVPGQAIEEQQPSKFDFAPAEPGVLESAPAYSGMVSYRDFPRRAACIQSGNRCRCYTQQGTDYPTTLAQCEAFIEGRVSSFNPYESPRAMVAGRSPVPEL